METPKKEAARIIQIRGSGLKIKTIEKKEAGFVHKSEFSWDESYFSEKPSFEVNQKIEVVFLSYDPEKQRKLYSIRQALGTPWDEKIASFKKATNVIAEITGITSKELYCQIEPGIKGIIYPAELPFGNQTEVHLPDAFSRGDKIYARIKHFDHKKHRIELSILDCLTDINQNAETRQRWHKVLFENHPGQDVENNIHQNNQNNKQYYSVLEKLHHVLIIDDEQAHLDNIHNWLISSFPILKNVQKTKSFEEAFVLLKKGSPFDLIITDLRLKNRNGLDTAKKILDYHPDQLFLFTSSDPYGHIDVHATFKTQYPFASKNKKELTTCILKWMNGNLEQIPLEFFLKKQTLLTDVGFEHGVKSIGKEQINTLIKELKLESQADNVLLLDVNEEKKAVKILAYSPYLKKDLIEYAESIAYFSPVREIVLEEGISFDTFVDTDDPKYKNFFPFLSYTSYYGMPLNTRGIPIRYVLLLFFDEKNIISGNLIRQIIAKANLIQAVLEKMQVADIAQRYASTYLKGQLLSSMIHELTNKIGGLQQNIATINLLVSEQVKQMPEASKMQILEKGVKGLNTNYQSIEDLVSSYHKMDKGEYGAIDINEVTRKAIWQLGSEIRSTSEAFNLQIITELEDNLPKVWSIEGRLEQVIINLVLNAIQQIKIQASSFENSETKVEYKSAFKENFVFVKSSYDIDKNVAHLYILDTGQGINYNNREKIFHQGFSTRGEGHGLGLYISRNIITQMGGRIDLIDSILFIGSLFRIELPLNADQHEPK